MRYDAEQQAQTLERMLSFGCRAVKTRLTGFAWRLAASTTSTLLVTP